MSELASYKMKKASVILAVLFCITSLTVIVVSAQQQQQQQQQQITGSGVMVQQMGSMVQQMGTGTMAQQMVTNSGILVQKMPGYQEKDILKLGEDNVIRAQVWTAEQGETVHQLVWLDKSGKVLGQQAWIINKDGSVTSQQQQMGQGGTMVQQIGTMVQQIGTNQNTPGFQQKDLQKLGQGVIRQQTWQQDDGEKVYRLVWLDQKGNPFAQQAWAVSKDGKTVAMQQQQIM